MRRAPLLFFAFLPLLSRCGEPRTAKPAHLADVLEQTSPLANLTLTSHPLTLTLDYNPFVLGCLALSPKTTATVNGEPLSAVSLGEGFADGELGPSQSDQCKRPAWTVPDRAADEAVTSFVVQDEATTLKADFENVAAPRSAAQADAGVLHPGDPLQLDWSPPTDTPYVDRSNGFTMTFSFQPQDGGSTLWPESEASATTGALSAQVPSGQWGKGTLWLSGRALLGVAQCSPANLACAGYEQVGGIGVPLDVEP